MHGPSIEFTGVGLSLGNTRVLEDVSFSVRAGSIHCIVGPNGGGKTSLIRSLLGQMPHTGSIEVRWQESRVTGYVPQVLDFDRSLPVTVLDFMALTGQRLPAFLGPSKARRGKVDEALERMGLKARRNTLLGSLSGGERQRLLFAQAMIPEPALLALDEPMAGVDLSGEGIIEGAIRDFARRGGTVVWINHDLGQVREIADAMTCINRRVVLDGPPREVLAGEQAGLLFPGLAAVAREARA